MYRNCFGLSNLLVLKLNTSLTERHHHITPHPFLHFIYIVLFAFVSLQLYHCTYTIPAHTFLLSAHFGQDHGEALLAFHAFGLMFIFMSSCLLDGRYTLACRDTLPYLAIVNTYNNTKLLACHWINLDLNMMNM